jgi:competence protein ComEC
MPLGGAHALARHVPLAMLAALVVGLALGPFGAPVATAAAGAVVMTVVGWMLARNAHSRAAIVALAVACLCAGTAWGAARVQATEVRPLTRWGHVQGTVVVDQWPSATRRAVRAQVIADGLWGSAAPAAGARLLLDLPSGTRPPEVGEVIQVSGTIGPAAQDRAPDWWFAWLRRKHIAARVKADGWTPVGTRGGAAGDRDALRRWAARNVAAGLSGDIAAIVRGMALGGGMGMSEDTSQRMRDAGLWHLLAVSGQNVAVVGIGMAALLGAAGASRRSRLVGMGLAMGAYCLACDGGASVARAGLMGGLALAADFGGAPRLRWHALLLALAVLLAWDPLSIDDPGLQLSFAAVCGLFVIAPPVGRWLRGWLPGPVADLVAQSTGAGLATAPVLASGFGNLSTVGLLANLIAVPVAGPVVVIALVGTVAHALWAPLGVLVALVAAIGAWIVLLVARVASSIPGAVVPMPGWAALPLSLVAGLPPTLWWWLRRVPGVTSPRGT